MQTNTQASEIISASPHQVYEAFVDPAILLAWLPPDKMTGRMHAFDASVGGEYDLSLYYPADEHHFKGKTADKEDRIKVKFSELIPQRRIIQRSTFVTDDPAFLGEMKITTTFEEVPGGTLVTMIHENLPPGLKPEDDETGSRMSLKQLAAYFEKKGELPDEY